MPRQPRRRGPSVLAATLAVAVTLAALSSGPAGSGGAPLDTPAAAVHGADGGGPSLLAGRSWPAAPRATPDAAPRATPGPAPDRPADPVAPRSDRPVREPAAPRPRRAPEGWLVAGGSSPVAGTVGWSVTYTVEIADGLEERVDLAGFAATVTAILSDPDRGWSADGTVRLQRIDDPELATIRVLLADPTRVDALCATADLDTRGRYSCWNGWFAALNADRWFEGVPHVADLDLYRTYLVNHEVGHGLGHGHRPCPSPGSVAPVMMQLTVSDEGCVPNAWPHP